MLFKRFNIFYILILLIFVIFCNAFAEEPLDWYSCIKEAAKNHPDLIAALDEVKQSEAAKKIIASTLFPQIDGSVSASTARTTTAAKTTTSKTYSYDLTGTQLLFDGTKTIQDVNAAGEDIKAAKQSFKFTSVTVRSRLRNAFVNLLKAQSMLDITQEIQNIRRGNLELITLKYASGLEHKGALLTAEADLYDAIYGVSQSRRNMEACQRGLIKEMGRLEFAPIKVKGVFEVRDSVKIKPDFESLAKNNPSLQQIIFQKNAAAYSLKSAYANFSPELSASGGAGKSSSRWPPKNDSWDIGVTLSMPIFEGGLRLAQVSQAQGLLDQLKENERSARDGLVLTLEQAWAALEDAIDNVEVQKKFLIATQERSEIAQAQYSVGLILFDNWIIIEDNLVKAKKSFLDAQANALLLEANWIKAKGETLEYE